MATGSRFPVRNTCLALGLISIWSMAAAQSPAVPDPVAQSDSVPITQLISTVARKTGKKFIVDPKVRADVVLMGQEPSALDYSALLEVLHVYGYTAAEDGGYVRVVPLSNARVLPMPLVTGKESHPDAQFVTKLIPVKTMPAVTLVPLLRPMIPQEGHLVAVVCTNVLVIVDTFGNVMRMDRLVQALDTGVPYIPEKCVPRDVAGPRDGQ